MFVIDASPVLAWCFADETSLLADAVLDRLTTEEAVAPAIWPLEVANALRTAERRGRIGIADTARIRELLLALPIRVEPASLADALMETTELARAQDLTAYDAAYLGLAARRGLPLATTDARLREACLQSGVQLLG